MILAVWSAKGGSGVSTVCAALTVVSQGVLIDLTGDSQQLFGRPGPAETGFVDWLHADATVRADALAELIRGSGPAHIGAGMDDCLGNGLDAQSAGVNTHRVLSALAWLERNYRTVVIDLGTRIDPLAESLAAAADRSVVVVRPCVLSIRAAFASQRTVAGAVVVGTGSGKFQLTDIEALLGVPVLARVAPSRAVAKCVDEESFNHKPPRRLLRAVAPLLGEIP